MDVTGFADKSAKSRKDPGKVFSSCVAA